MLICSKGYVAIFYRNNFNCKLDDIIYELFILCVECFIILKQYYVAIQFRKMKGIPLDSLYRKPNVDYFDAIITMLFI